MPSSDRGPSPSQWALGTTIISTLRFCYPEIYISVYYIFPVLHSSSFQYIVQCWCRVMPLRTPFRLLIPLFTISHNHLFRCVAFTQLTIWHANIPFLTSTHTLLAVAAFAYKLRRTLSVWLPPRTASVQVKVTLRLTVSGPCRAHCLAMTQINTRSQQYGKGLFSMRSVPKLYNPS
jgi:hypothetical protein